MARPPEPGAGGASLRGRVGPADRQLLQNGIRGGLLLVIIGVAVGGADAAGSLNKLSLLIVPGAVIVADGVVFAVLDFLFRHGRLSARGARWWIMSQFDLFAVAFLYAAWGTAGGGLLLAVVLGVLGIVMALVGLRWRTQVFTAFIRPGSSRLAIVLALIPALGAGGGSAGLIMARSLAGHGTAVGVIMLVVSLYVLLFAQSATIKISQPDWAPELPPRRKRRRAG